MANALFVANAKNISVADRTGVALLDGFVVRRNECGRRDLNPHGPKPTRT